MHTCLTAGGAALLGRPRQFKGITVPDLPLPCLPSPSALAVAVAWRASARACVVWFLKTKILLPASARFSTEVRV